MVKTATFDADQLVVKAWFGPSAQWKKHIIGLIFVDLAPLPLKRWALD